MKVVGNVLWLVLAGLWLAIGYVIAGFVNLVFIVTIPFGLQAFKIAGFVLWPFGKVVVTDPDRHKIAGAVGNVIWVVISGIWLAMLHALVGAVLCATIIGIPFGKANFRMARLALWPFGKVVMAATTATRLNLEPVIKVEAITEQGTES